MANVNYYNALLGKLFDDGQELPLRGGLNFVGFDVVPSQYGYDLTLAAEVPASRAVFAGAGLIGGGDLSVDRTINVAPGDATIVVAADSIRAGVMGSTNFADGTIGLPRLTNAAAAGAIAGRKISGGPQWAECTPAELNLITNLANTIALANLANAAAQFRIIGRRTAGGGAWEDSTAAQLNLLTTAANTIALANLANAAAQFRVMGRKTAGAGAWEDATGPQLGLVQNFDVKAYGAIGDGVADDTLAINAAKTAAVAAGGGVVYFPPGNYRTSAPIGLSAATGVVYRGAGRRSSFVRPENNSDVFTFVGGCDGCGIEDLAIERNSGNFPTAGTTIFANVTTRCFVRNVSVSKSFNAAWVISSTDLVIENLAITQPFSTRGITCEGSVGAPNERVRIAGLTCRNPYGATPVRRGAWVTATAYAIGDVVTSNSALWQAQNAASSGATAPILNPGSVATAHTTPVSDGAVNWRFVGFMTIWIYHYDNTYYTKLSGCAFEGGDYALQTTGTGNLQAGLRSVDLDVRLAYTNALIFDRGNDIEFIGTRVTQTLNGEGIVTTGNLTGNLRLLGGVTQLCRNAGILLNGSTDLHVRGFRVLNNSQSGAGASNGITTAGGLVNFSIIDCQCSGANQAAGIGLSGTNDQYSIIGCDLTGNQGAIGLGDSSALTATKRVVRDNIAAEEEHGTIALTGRTTALPATNFFTFIPRPGIYVVNIYTEVTVAGGGTMDHQVNFQDDLGPSSYTTASGSERASLAGTTRTMVRSVTFRHSGISHISLQTIFNAGSGTYSIFASCERVGNVAN